MVWLTAFRRLVVRIVLRSVKALKSEIGALHRVDNCKGFKFSKSLTKGILKYTKSFGSPEVKSPPYR